ncbi:MAG TPA: DUF433 domain-containing protein [Fodinibius sp.]|nr:DUF433 domain-containing protein [Fodinibius sp.]
MLVEQKLQIFIINKLFLTKLPVMKPNEVVSRNPQVMNGTLVFAGTRVPVEILIQHLVAGDTLERFLDDFPTVSRKQAEAYLKMTLETADAARTA